MVNDFLHKNGPHLAAATAYYTLFSIFPLTLFLISILGFIMGSEANEIRIGEAIGRLVPVSRETLSENLQVVARTRHISGILGILGLFWTSTTVFGAIRKGVNSVWGIAIPRPFFQERFIDFALMAGAGFLILIPMTATFSLGFLGAMLETIYIPRESER